MDALLVRFSKAYLDTELLVHLKVMDPNSKSTDFRFINQITGSWSSPTQGPTPTDSLGRARWRVPRMAGQGRVLSEF